MSKTTERLIEEIKTAPESAQREVFDFLVFLKTRHYGQAKGAESPPKRRRRLPPDDPLLNLDKFGFSGPGDKLTSEQIDRIAYGV